MAVADAIKPKNSILSIKGFILIACMVVAAAGAITLWAVLDGANNSTSYWSGLMILIVFFNFAGYLLGLPLIFAWMAVLFWAVAGICVQQLDAFRRTSPKNDDIRAAMAGGILLITGSAGSFLAVPSDGFAWSSIIDIIVLTVAAVFDIIGGAILANIQNHVASTQVFVVLAIFAVAIIFGSKSLMYSTLALSTILFATLLNGAFPGGNKKARAAYSLAWIGVTISMVWSVISIAVLREEKDKFEDSEGSSGSSSNKGSAEA